MRESWKDNILPTPVCYARRDQIRDSSSRFQRPPRCTNARKRVAKIGGGENVSHKNVPVRKGERTRSQASSRACLHEGCFPSGQETVYRGCASSSPPVYAGRRFLRREWVWLPRPNLWKTSVAIIGRHEVLTPNLHANSNKTAPSVLLAFTDLSCNDPSAKGSSVTTTWLPVFFSSFFHLLFTRLLAVLWRLVLHL